jgi:UDP-N-acetylglucosamine 2-epimerase (non-hydrolysing)
MRVLTVLGTRPEVIKLAPVVRRLEAEPASFRVTTIASGQHADMLYPFAERFGLRIHRDLKVMRPSQTPSGVCCRVLEALDALLTEEAFDVMLVQGDTTTAMAGSLAAFHRGVRIGHVEAGLRSGDPRSPFPEEMNRRLITRLATWHFAATSHNRRNLLEEGVPERQIFVTGNPVVDAVQHVSRRAVPGARLAAVLAKLEGRRLIVLTTHRRESFGAAMRANMKVLRDFVSRHGDLAMIFPVHPNPVVVRSAQEVLAGQERIELVEPLGYEDFLALLGHSWLIASDSGGVQEEAPTLGKPLIVLRENTERPEAIESGVARLAGGDPERLRELLEEVYDGGSWAEGVAQIPNPFGRGDAAGQIAAALREAFDTELGVELRSVAAAAR